MTTNKNEHRPQCEICHRVFTPDPRSGDRQKCCGRVRCRREYKKRWRQAKYFENEQFREDEKARVQRWRRDHPDYWQRSGQPPGSDPPTAVAVQLAAEKVAQLEYTLNGFVLHTTECADREGLELMLTSFAARGKDVLVAGGGQ